MTREEIKELIREVISEELKIDIKKSIIDIFTPMTIIMFN